VPNCNAPTRPLIERPRSSAIRLDAEEIDPEKAAPSDPGKSRLLP